MNKYHFRELVLESIKSLNEGEYPTDDGYYDDTSYQEEYRWEEGGEELSQSEAIDYPYFVVYTLDGKNFIKTVPDNVTAQSLFMTIPDNFIIKQTEDAAKQEFQKRNS